ncbi:MAG: hypothetical protein P1S46_12220, partial [bacterium]|nr:hypothetical protein [bacterium]
TVAPGYVRGRLREKSDEILQLSQGFVAQTAALFPNVKPYKETETWDKVVTLSEFRTKYEEYFRLVDQTIKQLKDLAETIAEDE